MKVKQWIAVIVIGLILLGLFATAVVDGFKQKAIKDAEANRYKLRVWDLTNNDEQYWKAWSEQRNLFADRLLSWRRFHNLRDDTPPLLPHTAQEYLAEYDSPDRKNMLLIERLDMNEFEKVNAEFLKRYPIVSLEERLQYENGRRKDSVGENEKHKLELATRSLHDQWNEYYRVTEINDLTPDRPLPHQDRLSRGRRHEALQTLHREGLRAFANVTAFGFDRTPQIDLYDLRFYEVPEFVQLPQDVYVPSSPGYHLDLEGNYDNLNTLEKWLVENLRKDYPKYMHLAFYHQFTEDIAYAKDFRQAAGFRPHAVRDAVNWRYDLFHPISNPGWHVQRMELVSLLKFKEPAVYISDMLPNMKQLVDGKTRPLDDFEAEAMQKIYGGEFIVTQGNDTQLRMVGAVRAGETCVQCHAVKSGELLGAFSYVLKR